MKLIGKRLLDDAFAEDATGVADCRRTGPDETTHHIEWGEGVSSGIVAIEAAPRPSYTGTWEILDTVTFDGTAPKVDIVRLEGSYGAMRHRITQIVTDGTVRSKVEGS